MSRKQVLNDNDLDALIPIYQKSKKDEKQIKGICEDLNKRIKQTLKNMNLTEYRAGDLQVTISETPREDTNELQAIEILRSKLSEELFNQVVKTKEYIDDDAFESLVYQKKLDASILQPAITPLPPTVTLRIKKVKS